MATPYRRKSTFDKRFWTEECTEAVKLAARLRRTANRTNHPEDREAARVVIREKDKTIRRARTSAWRGALAEAARDGDLWKFAKWAKGTSVGQRKEEYFPTLQQGDRLAISAEGKANLLHEECFPPPPEVEISDI